METDFRAALTVQMATEGVVDFRETRLEEPAWWRYWRVMLKGMTQQNYIKLRSARYSQSVAHLSILARSEISPELHRLVEDGIKSSFLSLLETLMPWHKGVEARQQEEEAKELREAYIEAFGDPDDPEFQEQLRKDVELLKAGTPVPELEEVRLSRELRENMLRKEKAKA